MAMLLQLFVGMDVDGLVLTVDMGMGMGVAMGVDMDETAVGVDMGVDVGVFVGVRTVLIMFQMHNYRFLSCMK